MCVCVCARARARVCADQHILNTSEVFFFFYYRPEDSEYIAILIEWVAGVVFLSKTPSAFVLIRPCSSVVLREVYYNRILPVRKLDRLERTCNEMYILGWTPSVWEQA